MWIFLLFSKIPEIDFYSYRVALINSNYDFRSELRKKWHEIPYPLQGDPPRWLTPMRNHPDEHISKLQSFDLPIPLQNHLNALIYDVPYRTQWGIALLFQALTGRIDEDNFTSIFTKKPEISIVDGILFLARQWIPQYHIPTQINTRVFDSHMHSTFSHDSISSLEEKILLAQSRGIDTIAITDHDTIRGYETAVGVVEKLKRENRLKEDFLLIPGIEISSREGHIVGLFVTSDIPSEMSAQETIAAIHAQGGIAVAAHPTFKHTDGSSSVGMVRAMTLPFDAVEVKNPSSGLPLDFTQDQWIERWGLFSGKTKLFGSDDHSNSWLGQIGYTRVNVKDKSLTAFKNALMLGDTKIETMPYYNVMSVISGNPIFTALFTPIHFLEYARRLLEFKIGSIFFASTFRLETNWEKTYYNFVNLFKIHTEIQNLSQGKSEFQKSLKITGISISFPYSSLHFHFNENIEILFRFNFNF